MTRLQPLAAAFLLVSGLVGCGAEAPADDAASAGGGAAPTAGAASGGSSTGGSVNNVPLAGSGQALGGGDQGMLFGPGGSVKLTPPEMGGGGGGGPVIPGDGNTVTSMIRGGIDGTATFTQKGEDVTVVVELTGKCGDGNHQFRIYDGYSCDAPSTEGEPWVPRGVGIGPDSGIACSNGKGSLTYTRSGTDKTKNWTVADHVQETDLTAHVVIVSDEKDPNSRAACGNFF